MTRLLSDAYAPSRRRTASHRRPAPASAAAWASRGYRVTFQPEYGATYLIKLTHINQNSYYGYSVIGTSPPITGHNIANSHPQYNGDVSSEITMATTCPPTP